MCVIPHRGLKRMSEALKVMNVKCCHQPLKWVLGTKLRFSKIAHSTAESSLQPSVYFRGHWETSVKVSGERCPSYPRLSESVSPSTELFCPTQFSLGGAEWNYRKVWDPSLSPQNPLWQFLLTSLMPAFNTVPHVLVTHNHKIIFFINSLIHSLNLHSDQNLPPPLHPIPSLQIPPHVTSSLPGASSPSRTKHVLSHWGPTRQFS